MTTRSFLLAAMLVPATAISQAAPVRVKLVRCAEGSATPCATVPVELNRQEGATAVELNDSTGDAAWRGRLGGVPLAGARELPRERQLTFGLGATEAAALGRTAMTGRVELRRGNNVVAVRRISWRPPLLAAPVFQGVADSNALSPTLKEILLAGGNSSMRPLVALLMALLVVSAWLLVPRLAWTAEEIQVKRSHPSSVTRGETLTGVVVETAPRKPEDITQQTARRTAMKR